MTEQLESIVSTAEDDRIVELVSSGVRDGDDGTMEVYLEAHEESYTGETGLRLTEDDALALADALRRAASFVAGRDPQAFIRVAIVEPNAADGQEGVANPLLGPHQFRGPRGNRDD